MAVVGNRKGTDLREPSQVLHGCRPLGSGDVRLSPVTSATLGSSYTCLDRLPVERGRKVGMTSSQHGLYVQGYTHATMAGTEGSETARRSESHKAGLSSDCRLQPACMKLEVVV